MFAVPETFRQKMMALFGEKGVTQLERLPAILAACAQQWQLTLGPPFAHLSFHYVAPAMRADGTAVILKVCSPTGEFHAEVEALRLFDGHGMAQLLAFDATNEAMLLERLQPGTLLSSIEDDEKATTIAAAVMREMWRPAPQEHPFPSVADWGRGFTRLRTYYGGYGPFPRALLEQAESLFAELSASMAEPVLLHGDLHHENILAAERRPWLAIDPKGLIGEPAYEVGALLRNPLPRLLNRPDPGRVLARRVDILAAELGLDRARVRGWGMAQAVLSAWWCVEDEGRICQHALTVADLLSQIKIS